MTLAAIGLSDPDRRIEDSTIQDIIEWLHRTIDPDTGKKHSLTKISRIAGASKGWTDDVRHNGFAARRSKKGQKYETNLRHYVRDLLRTQRRTDEHVDHPVSSEPEMPQVFHSGGVPIAGFPRKPEPRPVLAAPEIPAETPERFKVVAADDPEVIQDFHEEYQRVREDLWVFAERFDGLERIAPGNIYRSAVGKFRDKLLDLLQEL
jgi:hypothetical protein